jgi:hypothetical protein
MGLLAGQEPIKISSDTQDKFIDVINQLRNVAGIISGFTKMACSDHNTPFFVKIDLFHPLSLPLNPLNCLFYF